MGKRVQNKSKIIVIVGPTATGKSDLAVFLAKAFNGEVLSSDSRQVYKGLDIGSGKITKAEMQGIPHHLLSIINPKEKFSVADFKKLGEEKIIELLNREVLPIIAGGTGFYIQALVDNIILPEIPPNEKLREKLEGQSVETLYKKLKKLDPRRAETIDQNNKRRIIRAIEIIEVMGYVPEIGASVSNYNPLFIGIDLPDEELKEKIHDRLSMRIENGMIEEVRKLKEDGLSWERLEGLGLEYRYIAEYLQEKISKEEMVEKIKTESWHLVKRQRMWFKRDKRIVWFNPNDLSEIKEVVEAFLK